MRTRSVGRALAQRTRSVDRTLAQRTRSVRRTFSTQNVSQADPLCTQTVSPAYPLCTQNVSPADPLWCSVSDKSEGKWTKLSYLGLFVCVCLRVLRRINRRAFNPCRDSFKMSCLLDYTVLVLDPCYVLTKDCFIDLHTDDFSDEKSKNPRKSTILLAD